jgi:hypothetical protein
MPAPTPRCLCNEIQPLSLDAQLLALTTRCGAGLVLAGDTDRRAGKC